MVFSSCIFVLYFIPCFLLLYHLVANRQYKNLLILFASIFFYSWGAPKFVFVILASTIIDFYLVRWMHLTPQLKRKKILLAVSISLNLGLLLFFKYANFFVENLNGVLNGIGFTAVEWTSIALPIGISFYTFQTLTYSIDIYRKVEKPLDKVTDYLLYIMMFPQMIAGPIVRFNTIASQITKRREDYGDKLYGVYRFIIGLAKKMMIANVMGAYADSVMTSDLLSLSSTGAWLGILAYTFQIYFDFSAYSDMAIGLGRMMGFRFPENFNNPYVSLNITEFWRRWHITLGLWMRDYLYIPLGGSKVASQRRVYFNLWFVFLVSGLWHGASWSFVAWGAYHGFFLIMERWFLKGLLKKMGAVVSLIYTFFVVVCGWVVFRIEDFDKAIIYYKKLFILDVSGSMPTIPDEFIIVLILAILFSFITLFSFGKKLEKQVFYSNFGKKGHLVMLVLVACLLSLSIGAITTTGFNPFIYFRF